MQAYHISTLTTYHLLYGFKGFLLFSIEVILHITVITFSEKIPVKLIIMKQIIVSLLLCTAFANLLFGQSNREVLIKEAEEKLKTNKATISQILTNKKYDVIHPETPFRNIIEKYANAETISIATDSIPGKKIKVIGTVKNSEGKPLQMHWFICTILIAVAGMLSMRRMYCNMKAMFVMQDYSVMLKQVRMENLNCIQ